MLGVDVDRFLQDGVVLLGLCNLLHDAIGALVDLLQFFILARVQVFLELAAPALKVAVLVDQLALARGALAFGQRAGFALELLGCGLQGVALRAQVASWRLSASQG